MKVYCARAISAGDVQTITTLMERNSHMNCAALSRLLCELWQWRKPNGELKDMTAFSLPFIKASFLKLADEFMLVKGDGCHAAKSGIQKKELPQVRYK